MTTYHINPDNLKVSVCRAVSPKTCWFAQVGDVPEHYKTKEEALARAEWEGARRYDPIPVIIPERDIFNSR